MPRRAYKLQEKPPTPQKEPITSKHDIYTYIFLFCGSFCFPGSGSGFLVWIRIPSLDPDPEVRLNLDSKPWIYLYRYFANL
jgi:hypothetical protein